MGSFPALEPLVASLPPSKFLLLFFSIGFAFRFTDGRFFDE